MQPLLHIKSLIVELYDMTLSAYTAVVLLCSSIIVRVVAGDAERLSVTVGILLVVVLCHSCYYMYPMDGLL